MKTALLLLSVFLSVSLFGQVSTKEIFIFFLEKIPTQNLNSYHPRINMFLKMDCEAELGVRSSLKHFDKIGITQPMDFNTLTDEDGLRLIYKQKVDYNDLMYYRGIEVGGFVLRKEENYSQLIDYWEGAQNRKEYRYTNCYDKSCVEEHKYLDGEEVLWRSWMDGYLTTKFL